MKSLLLIIILSIHSNILLAQPIKIGDKIPSTIFEIFNYKKQKATLSDFKGKLVILDFGTLSCIPCIRLLPHVEELRKQFKDSIEIFWVVPSLKSNVEKFFNTNRVAKGLDVPVIYAAQQLWEQFEPQDWPFQVWIDRNGIIKARTNAEYLTSANISWMLSGKPINWVAYRKEKQYDFKQPLLKMNDDLETIVKGQKLYHSVFLGHINGLMNYHGAIRDSAKGTMRTYLINENIIDGLNWLNGKKNLPFGFHKTRILLNVSDTSRFIYYNSPLFKIEWHRKNDFSYEVVHPLSINDNLRKENIIKDITDRFNIDVCYETRSTPVYNIVNTKYSPSPGKKQKQVDDTNRHKEWMSFDSFINIWNDQYFQRPLLNKTGIDKSELRKFRWFTNKEEVMDLAKLKKMFSDYGLEILEESEELELMVITEK